MQPNILFLQADQFSASALSTYGNRITQTPHLDSLAEDGVVFGNAYCNNPLCVPSRASMLSGRLGSNIEVYDNGSELRSSVPTFVHYLRSAGYKTCLVGKMHFVGPDQLHGFEERLTTDIYPSSFIWSEHWEHFPDKHELAVKTFQHVGPCQEHRQLAFDDNVVFQAERKIYELAMEDSGQPFFLTASFSSPHEPYLARQRFWDLYQGVEIDLPRVTEVPEDQLDYHSRDFEKMYRFREMDLEQDKLREVRRAYYANVSYVDDNIGRLLRALKDTGLDRNTIIVFTSDHGDMLGERGLWWKKHLFEDSTRVPLILNAPERFHSGRVAENVSLVDLFPTLIDLAGLDPAAAPVSPIDGHSLSGLLTGGGDTWPDTVFCETFDGGTPAPMFMVRRGRYKYICCPGRPSQLYDLEADPLELNNLSGHPRTGPVEAEMAALAGERWDAAGLAERIRVNQDTRRFLRDALANGKRTSWDYNPEPDGFYTFKDGLSGYYEWFAARV